MIYCHNHIITIISSLIFQKKNWKNQKLPLDLPGFGCQRIGGLLSWTLPEEVTHVTEYRPWPRGRAIFELSFA